MQGSSNSAVQDSAGAHYRRVQDRDNVRQFRTMQGWGAVEDSAGEGQCKTVHHSEGQCRIVPNSSLQCRTMHYSTVHKVVLAIILYKIQELVYSKLILYHSKFRKWGSRIFMASHRI